MRAPALAVLIGILLIAAALLGCKQLSKSESGAAPSTSSAPPVAASSTTGPAASAPATPATPNCEKAAACCKVIAEKSGYKKQENKCEKFEKYSDARCKTELAQLQQAARLIGADCK